MQKEHIQKLKVVILMLEVFLQKPIVTAKQLLEYIIYKSLHRR